MSRVADIADWAIASPFIDGVLFSPSNKEETVPICAVAQARGFRGFGKGMTRGEALTSALGESMEQYAAAQIPCQGLVWASYKDLDGCAFDPRWLYLYSEEQYQRPGFPYQPFSENEPRHWVRGWWLDNEETVYMPASAVYMSTQFADEDFCQITSNGLGAGPTLRDAAHRAALELRERDAFITSWVSGGGAVQVRGADSSRRCEPVAARLQAEGAQLETYLVAHGDPAFVAVSVGLGDGVRWPAVTLGLGAAETGEEAIDKALLEHGQTGPVLAELWKAGKTPVPKAPEEIQTLQDHALYYCCASHRGEFDQWRDRASQGVPRKSPNARIAIADLTPPELRESPFRVARALGKGLQPIHYGHGMERIQTDDFGAVVNKAPLPIC